jgi:MarR family transcriptional regulator, 2-MHQ and catechol-resistance regulon repressor
MTAPHDLMVGLLELRNAFDRRSEIFLTSFGLTGAQLNILNLLGEAGGTMTQAIMSERVLIGKSSLSLVINRMVQRGFIRRQVFRKDRRRVILRLTAPGRRLWERVYPLYKLEVDEAFGVITAGRRKPFLDDMKQLESALRIRRAIPSSR